MLKKSSETRFLLSAVKANLSLKGGNIPDFIKDSDIDWQKFKDLIIYHELYSFIYPKVREFTCVPADLMWFLKQNYYGAMARAEHLWREFLRISEALSVKGIDMVPLKGISVLADIYSDMPVRLMTDIDILVRKERIKEVKDVFLGLGYSLELGGLTEEYWLTKQCHIAFWHRKEKKPIFVDVHFNLDFKRRNKEILPSVWKRVRQIELNGRKIRLLTPEDELFALALHQRRFGKMLSLKNILDVALILDKYHKCFDWDYVLKEAGSQRMRSVVFFILLQANLCLETSIPDRVWKGLNIKSYKKIMVRKLIENNIYAFNLGKRIKELYLKIHFLLYDDFWEPVEYILNIPQEQFAKFYGLKAYDKKTEFLYANRCFYILLKAVSGLFSQKQKDDL